MGVRFSLITGPSGSSAQDRNLDFMGQQSKAHNKAAARVPFVQEQGGLLDKYGFKTQSFADGQLFAFSKSKAIPPSKHELLIRIKVKSQLNEREICCINAKFNKLNGRSFRMKNICSHEIAAPSALPTPAPTSTPTRPVVHSDMAVTPSTALVQKYRAMLTQRLQQINGKSHVGGHILDPMHPQ